MTPEERVSHFTTAFAKANPPPEPGIVPVKGPDVLATEGNRWPCKGGPMDGLGIAKLIALKKGAGKKKLHITVRPSSVIEIHSEDETLKGVYIFMGDYYEWQDGSPVVETLPDVWNNEYWERNK